MSANTLLVSLFAIAALDSLNPTATALQIYLLTTHKPVLRSITFILGVFIAYWLAGLLFALGLARFLSDVVQSIGWFIYVLQFILGGVLLIVGLKLRSSSNEPATTKHPQSLMPWHTFLFGCAVTFWEAPTALPYIAAIERMVQARLDLFELMGVLAFYNLIFVAPLLGILGIYITQQDRSVALLNGIQRRITRWAPRILRVLLIAIGLLLIIDSIGFALDRPLFPAIN